MVAMPLGQALGCASFSMGSLMIAHLSSIPQSDERSTAISTSARVFPEREHPSITILDHQLALSVDPILGALQDIGAPRAQVGGQSVHPDDVEVGVVRAWGPMGKDCGHVGAEEDLHLVPPQDGEPGWRIGGEADALSIPVAVQVESEHVSIILCGPHHV